MRWYILIYSLSNIACFTSRLVFKIRGGWPTKLVMTDCLCWDERPAPPMNESCGWCCYFRGLVLGRWVMMGVLLLRFMMTLLFLWLLGDVVICETGPIVVRYDFGGNICYWGYGWLPTVVILPLLFLALLSTPSKSWPERCYGNWWCEEPEFDATPITELFLLPGARFGVEGGAFFTESEWWRLWWCSLFSRRLSTSFLSYSRSFSRAYFYFRSYLLTRKSILFLSINAAFSCRLFSTVFDFSSLTMCNWSERLRIVCRAFLNLSCDSFSV